MWKKAESYPQIIHNLWIILRKPRNVNKYVKKLGKTNKTRWVIHRLWIIYQHLPVFSKAKKREKNKKRNEK